MCKIILTDKNVQNYFYAAWLKWTWQCYCMQMQVIFCAFIALLKLKLLLDKLHQWYKVLVAFTQNPFYIFAVKPYLTSHEGISPNLHQDAVGDKDELITFWGHKVKGHRSRHGQYGQKSLVQNVFFQ